MPQQINLCTPILLTQKRYFSAQTMAQALGVFVVLGGGLCAYWVWSLKTATEDFRRIMATRTKELATLQAAADRNKLPTGTTVDNALLKELQAARSDLAQREKFLVEMRKGMYQDGLGHSARLKLVASTIPAQVWITEVKASDAQLELTGYTLEPDALNAWIAKLSVSPLLQGQRLATARIERAAGNPLQDAASGAMTAVAAASQASAPVARAVVPRQLWSFTLASAVRPALAPASGARP